MKTINELDDYKYAWHASSFDPDKRFNNFKEYITEVLDNLKTFCNDNNYDPEYINDKIIDCACDYLHSQSSCMNWAVTGPANFPVSRNEKRMAATEKKHEKLAYYCNEYKKILKKKFDAKLTESDKVSNWKKEIEILKDLQETYKKVNILIRKHKLNNIEDSLKVEDLKKIFDNYPKIKSDLESSLRINYPFKIHGFKLTNNLANIKRLESQVRHSERTKENNHDVSFNCDFVKVEHDDTELRWNLYFDGKPSFEIRSILKSNGFKWSPKRTAWTRFSKSMDKERLENILYQLSEVK